MAAARQAAAKLSVEAICQGFGMSRQAYYQGRARRRERDAREAKALEVVRSERRLQQRLGTRKLYGMYYAVFRKLKLGRDALFDLLRRMKLLVRPRRRRYSTTNSDHGFTAAPNLLDGRRPPGRPNEVWASDITYIRAGERHCYAALVTDCYSRKIVGYDLSDSLSVEGSLRALRQALRARRKRQSEKFRPLIHHSDRGVQYACGAYKSALSKAKARPSMASRGNPYENPLAERVNGILKDEYGLGETFTDLRQAKEALREAVQLYNERRPHTGLGKATPAMVHAGKTGRYTPPAAERYVNLF
jgi:transposase InsO family protein